MSRSLSYLHQLHVSWGEIDFKFFFPIGHFYVNVDYASNMLILSLQLSI